MPIAYHIIFSMYGFWLPNDPRGSGSDFVRQVRLLPYGHATKTCHIHSVAHDRHDRAVRLLAKEALTYPPVILTTDQINSVSRGFEHRLRRSNIKLFACAILPDHVHMVLPRHERSVTQLTGQLKSSAAYQLRKDGLHPLRDFADEKGTMPSPWGRKMWKTFLDTPEEMNRAVTYVNENPMRAGLGMQDWGFVVKAGV